MENKFRQALEKGEFVVTCEMIPGRGANEDAQIHEIEEMKTIYGSGRIHAISITDNPSGNPAILADTVGIEFLNQGIIPLVHFTCKDRSRNQIQSQLYSLERRGVENILFMSGDYQNTGFNGLPRPVFDFDPVQAIQLAEAMNEGLEVVGPRSTTTEKPTHFFGGAVVNPFKYTEGEAITQYFKLERKLLAGAHFIISQIGYDARKMQELIMYTKDRGYTTPMIANIFLATKGSAKLMQNGTIAGCYVTDEFIETLEAESQAEDKGKAARYERAAKQIAVAKGLGYAGVHIGGMNISAEIVSGILNRADELTDQWESLIPDISFGKKDGYYLYKPASDASGPLAYLNSNELAERTERETHRKVYKHYRLSRFFHHWVLTQNKRGYKILEKVMDWRERKKGLHRSHMIEHMGKMVLYGCLDCGDCGLEPCIYSCPMTACPKCQRNGPCGGSKDGWCEVFIGERYCIYYMAYHRLKKYNELYKLSSFTTPPNNWEFFETSGWSNYTHLRDNTARRIPVEMGFEEMGTRKPDKGRKE